MTDHSHMHHADMGHGGHGDMDMGDMCSMNMIFTWDYNNLCIIFKWWRITSVPTLIGSLIAIVVLTAGYEMVRALSRKYDLKQEARMSGYSSLSPNQPTREDVESSPLIAGRDGKNAAEREGKFVRAAFYAAQVFYSFFIMLLFMTYNGWVMIAVAVGAFVGYLGFTTDMPSAKTVACH